jgi:hypothetical protein
LICKKGVQLFGIRPEMLIALRVAEKIYNDLSTTLVITSVVDGEHSRGSLHYAGQAVDIRTRHAPQESLQNIVGLIATRLTDEFDVVLEKDHIHIEFQPKE